MSAQPAAKADEPRRIPSYCVYCGALVKAGGRACPNHSDLDRIEREQFARVRDKQP